MGLYLEEILMMVFAVFYVPVFFYGVEKLFKKNIYHPLVVLVVYTVLFYNFFDLIEDLMQGILV